MFQRLAGEDYNYASPVWPQPGDDSTQATATIDGLADETSYYFVVRAFVGADVSGDSNEINHVTGSPAPVTHSISTETSGSGTISPQSATVNAGGSRTFTITPGAGYHIADVLADGVSVGKVGTYTFSQVADDHVLRAVFAVNRYDITATTNGSGTVSPGGRTSVAHGGGQTYTMTAASGHRLVDVRVDGKSVGSVGTYAFNNVTGSHTIQASFEAIQYTIGASAGANGAITPSGQIRVGSGATRSFTITPKAGYRIADVIVDGNSEGAVGTYTFANIDRNHTISAAFTAEAFTIDASTGEGGSISPSGRISVHGQGAQSFTITADEGYEIEDLIVDGNSVGIMNSYQFSAVSANHTIQALFMAVNQAPTADAGPDQVVDEQATVTLSGLNSKDMDDGIDSFEWRQVSGAPVTLSATTGDTVTFNAPDVGVDGESLEFELTVTDVDGLVDTDRCIVNVTWVNVSPVADAGVDQSVDEGTTVVLNAEGTQDPDDGIEGYLWRQTRGPVVVLSDPSAVSPSFKAPDVGPQGASLVFELTVTDVGGLQDTDSCVVAVTWDNMEPLADAGGDQEVTGGDEVVLNGDQSMDPDGLKLTYQWRQTFGPPVELSDATAVAPGFTAPADMSDGDLLTFELTVTDSGGLQAADVCNITVKAGQPPEDTTLPSLTIDNPAREWALVFKKSYTLKGRASDDGQVVKVTWKNDRGGSGVVDGTDKWSKRVQLYRGANTITITAEDAAGNRQSKEVLIYHIKWGY